MAQSSLTQSYVCSSQLIPNTFVQRTKLRTMTVGKQSHISDSNVTLALDIRWVASNIRWVPFKWEDVRSYSSNIVMTPKAYYYFNYYYYHHYYYHIGVVGRLFGRVVNKRVKAGTECAKVEEQCGFRQGRGCMDKVFAVRQICEKYLANGKDVFWAFMDLENAYDTIDRHGMWQMQRLYGVCRKLFRAVQSFYKDSRVCVRV